MARDKFPYFYIYRYSSSIFNHIFSVLCLSFHCPSLHCRQVLGVGTALKIVLEDQENCALEQSGNTREAMEGVRHGDPRWSPLQRNEVIALINVLHRLSISVSHVQRLRQVEMDTAIVHFVGTGLGLFVVTTVAWFLWCMCGRRGRGETRNQSRRLVLEKKKN